MTLLEIRVWTWSFQALDLIRLDHAANTLRGALGYALQDSPDFAEWFRPEAAPRSGPSGFADLPRPFIIRAVHLDGAVIPPDSGFRFDMHSFETRIDRFAVIRNALASAAAAGLGQTRGRARLLPSVSGPPVVISLQAPSTAVSRIRVHFLTPTELKGGPLDNFGVLFARVRDRVATLRSVYGEGPPEFDFRTAGARARAVRTVRSRLHAQHAERTSSRTGQTHALGGQVGEVDFEGELTEFLPWLEAAQWTGVGRQTVWGKGAIRIDRSPA